jgi:predicted ferric reductase
MSSTLWNAIVWDIARAGGITAYVLLSLAVLIGLALSLRLQSARWPRLINNELHNFLSLLALIFTTVHVLAVWIDPYTNLGWKAIFIPLATTYHPLEMAMGIVALYLGLAVGISTWIRPWIGYAWWRRFHIVTLLVYLLSTLHGITIGTDTNTSWAIGLYAGSSILVMVLLLMRVIKRPARQKKRARTPITGRPEAIMTNNRV